MTAAHALSRRGADVDLFEAGPQVGGLARSIDLWGRAVDLGSHTFHSADPRVLRLWARLVGERGVSLPMRRAVVRGAALLDYPPRPWPTVRWLGPRRGAVAVAGALRARVRRPGPPTTARDAVERRFGPPLTDALFEPYCRKLWGRPSAEVDPAFATFLLATAAASGAAFLYPEDGTGSVWEQMASEIGTLGGRVHLRSPVLRVHTAQDGSPPGRVVAVETPEGLTPVDHVVSSLPLPLLVRALADAPDAAVATARALSSRGTVLVYLRLRGTGPLPWTWVYDYDPGHATGRFADVAGWSVEPPDDGTSVVSAECWGSVGGDVWRLDDEAVTARVLHELAETRLLPGAALVASTVVRLPGTHPECPLGTAERLTALGQYVATVPGLVTVGRHGQHGTPGIGDCMEMALDTVDELLGSPPPTDDGSPKTPGHRTLPDQEVAHVA